MNGGRVESSSDFSPLSVPLRYSDSKFPSSNCANVIISPVCSFEDVVYGMLHCRPNSHWFWIWLWSVRQSTRKSLIKSDIAQRYDIAFVGYVNRIPFLMLCNSNKDTTKTLWYWWPMFNAFVPTCLVAFCTTHGKIKQVNAILKVPYLSQV